MTILELILSASAVFFSGSAIAYTLHVVRKTPDFEYPTDAQLRHMIETAPRTKFDKALEH